MLMLKNLANILLTIGLILAVEIIEPTPTWTDAIIFYVAAFFFFFLSAIIKHFADDWEFWKQFIGKIRR